MIGSILTSIEFVYAELLLFCVVWILIGALDDILIDIMWLVRRGYRKLVYYRSKRPLKAGELPPPTKPGLLAIFVPTWNETNVIGAMLAQCDISWRDSGCEHLIYVGCYPNDKDGIEKVAEAAALNSRIRTVLVEHEGPTTKADCLNQLWQRLVADELATGHKAKAIILHDAEDCVHRDELCVFDRLIEKSAAVQLPVIPVRTEKSQWISGHYCDEFAEAHGKLMVVRESIGAALPLAGVGCAIDRNLLGRIALESDGRPFDEGSLTEDYELGLSISSGGGRTMMARILDDNGNLVGTKAHFPDTWEAAIRQKSRWLTGIALAGWDRLGWRGNLAEKWMLLHDRKSVLSAIVVFTAYICVILAALLRVSELAGQRPVTHLPPLIIAMLIANAFFLAWRIAVRAGFVWSIYGPRQAALSIPRSIIANLIAVMAAHRACLLYIRHCLGKPLVWEKTAHHAVPAAK